ncbi:hypothetical protein SEVIR_1G301400v4 [Setaria viridis]|uniref:Uncharacterized protein n=2 Tax=Setaria TaxID=4554 RepID=A0A368PSW2_SETIT|nr:hypothetical protein SETIT_1G296100v2 [Setaria italica]TKW41239.1 hypothetical protein SEVIR_1G301400v2 [Setaria viridis]
MGSNPAAADLTIALIPAAGDLPVAPIPGLAGSSSSSAAVQPRRNAYSVFQVLRALVYGAPVIAVLEDGYPAGAEERQRLAVRGRVRGLVVGTMNSYLRACGRIPMVCPEDSFDLNAAAAAPPNDTQLPPPVRGGGGFPLICAYCNCGFCFGVYEVPWLIPPPGYVCAELPVPATADLVALPAVEPLYGRGALPGPSSATPPVAARLLVCSNQHHFMVAMSMLRLARRAPSLVWRRPSSLGVLPAVVGGAGGGSLQQRRRATARPAAEPRASSAGASSSRNLVMPGDEDMVQLSLRHNHNPLNLSLGWR